MHPVLTDISLSKPGLFIFPLRLVAAIALSGLAINLLMTKQSVLLLVTLKFCLWLRQDLLTFFNSNGRSDTLHQLQIDVRSMVSNCGFNSSTIATNRGFQQWSSANTVSTTLWQICIEADVVFIDKN
jgi:hypothetical protein